MASAGDCRMGESEGVNPDSGVQTVSSQVSPANGVSPVAMTGTSVGSRAATAETFPVRKFTGINTQ